MNKNSEFHTPHQTIKQSRVNSIFLNRELLIVFFVSKILTILSLILFFYFFDNLHDINLWNRWYSGKTILDSLYLPFANWDGQHYLLLADYGYSHWQHSQAFYPLYPLLINVINFIFNNTYVSAFILNLVLSYFFCYFFYLYASYYFPSKTPIKALVLILCYPTAFFLTVFYSEALFLSLLFGFLYFYEVKKRYICLFFAILLPLSRGQAVFIIIGVFILVFIKFFRENKNDFKLEVSVLIAFVLGMIGYFLFFYFATGSFVSGLNAQKSFVFGNSLLNIFNPVHFMKYLFSAPKGLFSYTDSIIDKTFIVFYLFSFYFIIKSKVLSWMVLYIVLFYPVASMGAGGSFIRFSLLLIPFLSLSIWKSYAIKEKIIYVFFFGAVLIQLYFVYRFSLNMWVG